MGEIYRQARVEKELLWTRLADLGDSEADAVVAFAKGAHDEQTQRGDQLLGKGTLLLTASLALLTVLAREAEGFVTDVVSPVRAILIGGMAFVAASLVGVSMAALAAMGPRTWHGAEPHVVLTTDVIKAGATALKRNIALHYMENSRLNRLIADRRLTLLGISQTLLAIALALAAAASLLRLAVL